MLKTDEFLIKKLKINKTFDLCFFIHIISFVQMKTRDKKS